MGELGAAELGAALTQYGVKSPDTGNDISDPFPFNLMFKCGGWGLGHLVGWGCAAGRHGASALGGSTPEGGSSVVLMPYI